MRAAAAQCAVLRDPGLHQVPLHAGQKGLTVVKCQAERIEGRMGVGAATTGNFADLLRSIGAAQFDRHPPLHSHPPLFHASTLAACRTYPKIRIFWNIVALPRPHPCVCCVESRARGSMLRQTLKSDRLLDRRPGDVSSPKRAGSPDHPDPTPSYPTSRQEQSTHRPEPEATRSVRAAEALPLACEERLRFPASI